MSYASLDENTVRGPMAPPVRIVFGADYRASNSYQSLLYEAAGPSVSASPGSPADALEAMRSSPGPMVYHLHWEDHPTKLPDDAEAAQAAQDLIDGLEAFQEAGGGIIWTRHNLRPHTGGRHALHARLTEALHDIAHVIHVHSWPAVEAVLAEERLDIRKTVVIPHGNYAGRYKDWAAVQARSALDLHERAHVFLLYGRLAQYKGIAEACEAFASLSTPDARLVLAGVDVDGAKEAACKDPRIQLHGGFAADEDVGKFLAAADTVLLPYQSSLTSGTAILAQSFSRGVLGSDTPGIRDVVRHGQTGRVCDLSGVDQIRTALGMALSEGREVWAGYGHAAAELSRSRSWDGLGPHWARLFHHVARQVTPGSAEFSWIDRT